MGGGGIEQRPDRAWGPRIRSQDLDLHSEEHPEYFINNEIKAT